MPLSLSIPFSLAQYILVSLQDIVISGVFAFLFFCLAIATAVYGGRFGTWEEEFNDSPGIGDVIDLGDAADLNEDLGAVAVSSSIYAYAST